MPVAVLSILKLCLLAVIYLFLARVVRAVWVEIRVARSTDAAGVDAAATAPPLGRRAQRKADKRDARVGKQPKGAARPKLKIVEPPGQLGTTFALEDEVTVGRAPGCAVSLDDTFASQIHARVFHRDGQWFVEDLGSTNGTWINRKRVHGPMRMHPGDRLQVGNTVLELTR